MLEDEVALQSVDSLLKLQATEHFYIIPLSIFTNEILLCPCRAVAAAAGYVINFYQCTSNWTPAAGIHTPKDIIIY